MLVEERFEGGLTAMITTGDQMRPSLGAPSLQAIISVAVKVTRIPVDRLRGRGPRYAERTSTRYAIGRVARAFGYSSPQIAAALDIDHSSVVHGWHRNHAKADEIAAEMLRVLLGSDSSDPRYIEHPLSYRAVLRRQQVAKGPKPAPPKARVAPFPPGADVFILRGASKYALARRWPMWRIP